MEVYSTLSYVSSPHAKRTTPRVPIFQPPSSPASTANSSYFAASAPLTTPIPRKRPRPDSSHSVENNSIQHRSSTETPTWDCITPDEGLSESVDPQHSGLVNDRYLLAGGYDTPSAVAATKLDTLTGDDHYFQRRRLRDDDPETSAQLDHVPLTGPLARERNGVGREAMKPDTSSPGWTAFAFNLFGKAFSFGGSVIRGFYAGEGTGYELDPPGIVSVPVSPWRREPCLTPIPGAWDNAEFLSAFEDHSLPCTTSSTRPPNKRRQTERESWVLVGTPDEQTFSPKRKPSTASMPRGSAVTRPSASRASSRRSIAPISRRTSAYGSPALNHPHAPPNLERRASSASTRSPQVRPSSSGLDASYVSPEAERFAKRQAKQERAVDKSMTSMSRRLEDLIRQGQEALGTKYSVEDYAGADFEDEGFASEDRL